ncbi:MAG: DUF4397 domain-containing protein [Comamonadaceae bacterium]
MRFRFAAKLAYLLLSMLLAFSSPPVQAQPTGLLYDPEPPADSAYVRVLLASRDRAVDILVDGRLRIKALGAGQPSDYMVLPAGKHSIAVHPAGKPMAQASTTLDVVRGRALTVAFTNLGAKAVPIVFEDKANSNKLKALLAVYHLDATLGALDVLTADGNTKVFTDLVYGTSKAILVNPISVDLIAAKTGDKAAQANAAVAMAQGGTYSVLVLPGTTAKPLLRAVENKIERYTGK